jgi:hypothetical protein
LKAHRRCSGCPSENVYAFFGAMQAFPVHRPGTFLAGPGITSIFSRDLIKSGLKAVLATRATSSKRNRRHTPSLSQSGGIAMAVSGKQRQRDFKAAGFPTIIPLPLTAGFFIIIVERIFSNTRPNVFSISEASSLICPAAFFWGYCFNKWFANYFPDDHRGEIIFFISTEPTAFLSLTGSLSSPNMVTPVLSGAL